MSTPVQAEKRLELRVIALLFVILAPALSVISISAYGFIVWFLQLLMGPPGP